MKLEKLFEFISKEGKADLSEDFKSQLTDIFNVALSEKIVEIESLKTVVAENETEIEGLTEEVTKLKESILEDVKKEVEEYKNTLVEKIDSFLGAELEELIPEGTIEAQAKLEIYEPLVEGFKDTIARFGISIDSEGHSLLKDAKTEIESLTEDFNRKSKEFNELEVVSEKLLAKMTLMEKCQGLTTEQTEKISIVLSGKTSDEINEKFDTIRDLIVTEKTEVATVSTLTLVSEEVKPAGQLIAEKVENTLGQEYI